MTLTREYLRELAQRSEPEAWFGMYMTDWGIRYSVKYSAREYIPNSVDVITRKYPNVKLIQIVHIKWKKEAYRAGEYPN